MDVQWSVVYSSVSKLCGVTEPRLLTTQETAHFLGLSRNTVDRLRHGRQLPYYRIGGSVRFSQWDLSEVVNGRHISPAQVVGELDRVLTKRELARFFVVSTRTIENLIRIHGLWRRRIGRQVRFSLADVLAQFMSTYRVPAIARSVSA